MLDGLPSDLLDANADVLAGMAANGDDLSKARRVDFSHVFPQLAGAKAFCNWAVSQGYTVEIDDAGAMSVDVTVSRTIMPDLELLTSCEFALAEAAEEFGGAADGWGCFSVPKQQS